MTRKRDSRWQDIDGGSAFVIPYTLLRHDNYVRLSAYGNKLIADLARQYTGFNNGYLCASWSLMKTCGWKSIHTLRTAVLECEHYRLIVRTQQGGRNKPNLHGFTWRRIDEKKNGQALDMLPTLQPNNAWKDEQPQFQRTLGKRKPKRKEKKTSAPRA